MDKKYILFVVLFPLIFIFGCKCPDVKDDLSKSLGEKWFRDAGCSHDSVITISNSSITNNEYGATVCNYNYPCTNSPYLSENYNSLSENEGICIYFLINVSSKDYVRNDDNTPKNFMLRDSDKYFLKCNQIEEIDLGYKDLSVALKK